MKFFKESLIICQVLAAIYGSAAIALWLFPDSLRLVGVTKNYSVRSYSDILFAIGIAVCGLILLPLLLLVMGYQNTNRDEHIEEEDVVQAVSISNKNAYSVLFFMSLMLFLYVAPQFGQLMSRNYYIDDHTDASGFRGVTHALVMIPFACGAIHSSKTPSVKWWSVGLFTAFQCTQFALGTRKFGLSFIFWLLGYGAISGRRPSALLLIGGGVSALVGVAMAFYFRLQGSHGFVPYLEALVLLMYDSSRWGEPIELFIDCLIDPISVLDATISSYGNPTTEELIVIVSPLQGGSVDWPKIAPSLRLHEWVPYSGLGEMYRHGPVTEFLLFLSLSIMLELTAYFIRGLTPNRLPFLFLRLFAVVFALYISMYNARAAVRMIYYGIIAAVTVAVADNMFVSRNSKYGKVS